MCRKVLTTQHHVCWVLLYSKCISQLLQFYFTYGTFNSNQKNVKSGVTALSSTSNAFGIAVANGRFDAQGNGIDENLKLQALAEEEAAMNQFKVIPQQNVPFCKQFYKYYFCFSQKYLLPHSLLTRFLAVLLLRPPSPHLNL